MLCICYIYIYIYLYMLYIYMCIYIYLYVKWTGGRTPPHSPSRKNRYQSNKEVKPSYKVLSFM